MNFFARRPRFIEVNGKRVRIGAEHHSLSGFAYDFLCADILKKTGMKVVDGGLEG